MRTFWVPSSEMAPESEVKVPWIPRHSMPVGSLPLIDASVISWLTVLRWNCPMAGLPASLLARQFSLPLFTRNEAPVTCTIIESMFGSVPLKPEYETCQGSVSVRIVAVPGLTHGPSMAFVM